MSAAKISGQRQVRPLRDWSLKLRLMLFFSVLLVLVWLVAAGLAWRESREYIGEFFDTQQILFAKTLITADWESVVAHLPKTKPLLKSQESVHGKTSRGKEDKDALAFAVFTRDGELLLDDGEKGRRFRFEGHRRGFVNAELPGSGDDWRIFWVASADGQRVAAVGQEQEYRNDMAFDMLSEQMLPWVLLFPALLGGLGVMLHRELRPLREVAGELRKREPESAAPLATRHMPPEVRPLVEALNSLFARTAALLNRERAFVADAAHELRTPLAGLRIQAEVATLCADDDAARQHALDLLLQGIERCTRLVEQLLSLSRLEGQEATLELEPLNWQALVSEMLAAYRERAEVRNLSLTSHVQGQPSLIRGYPSLLAILLRNLLENALNYTPQGGEISLNLDTHCMVVRNSGPGVDKACLPRLGERFFRPPGQEVPGSGLGLSMVRHIAEIHGCTVLLENNAPSTHGPGFAVTLVFA